MKQKETQYEIIFVTMCPVFNAKQCGKCQYNAIPGHVALFKYNLVASELEE